MIAEFMKGRFQAVTGFRDGQQWDEARSTLAEIEEHAQDLELEALEIFELWVEIHRHLVEAARLRATFQDEPELARLGKARYGLEKLLALELALDSEARLRVEYMHADIACAELTVGLRVQGFDAGLRAELVQKRKTLFGTAMKLAQELGIRRLRREERFGRFPYWMQQMISRSHLATAISLIGDNGALLHEPTTLVAVMGGLVAQDGDPKVWLKPLFEEEEFIDSFRESTRAARDSLLAKPEAAELHAWMKTRWDAGLSAHRYEELMTQLQRDVGLGLVECLPDFLAFETAIQPEHRCRACASLIGKLAERAYRPVLQVLASLTKESVEARKSVGKLIGTLQDMWRDEGPLSLLDPDVATIRNAESHARTVHAAWGSSVTFENTNRVLGPMSGKELERKLESLLDRITAVHLFACYVGHPDDPRSLGRAVRHGTHVEVTLQQ